LLQLQTIFKQDAIKQHEKWETIAWSTIHIILCILILADATEAANIVVIGLLAGILLTFIIIVVGTCACYVIMMNGREWAPHVHLTCISFWIMAQYMSIRLPSDDLDYVTTVPVVLMGVLRVMELSEAKEKAYRICIEVCCWCVCIFLHILCDNNDMSKMAFFWGTFVTITFLILFNRFFYVALFMAALPFVIMALLFYILSSGARGRGLDSTLSKVTKMYDDWTAEPPLIPLDIEFRVERDFDGDFDDRL
jgi:hypothetical protein